MIAAPIVKSRVNFAQVAGLSLDLTLIDTDHKPDEERLVRQNAAFGKLLVQLRVLQGEVLIDVPVEHKREDRRHRVRSCVPDQQPALVQCDRSEVEDR